MKTRCRVISQDTLDHVYFASQHSLHHLCENIARNDCAFLPSRQVMGLLVKSNAAFLRQHVEVHQFRTYASQREVSPTPQGVHRDGVNFIFMMMVNRVNVINGEIHLYDLDGRLLRQHTLVNEMEAAIVNDEHVMHGVTPILQLDPGQPAFRDVLVVTFKKR